MSLVAILAASTACAGNHQLVPAATPFSPPPLGVSWLTPHAVSDTLRLSRWRAAVGHPLVSTSPTLEFPTPVNELTIVSWNMALGAGDVAALFRSLRAEHPARPVVLLLQEAFRGGDEVPPAPLNAAFARKIRVTSDREIDDVARALGLSLYYVPSMRNGAPGISHEDRGNAILSTLPLHDLAAIELPFEKQRRVAIAASVRGINADGRSWSLRLANAHLDNTSGPNRLWIGSEYARLRQARALRHALAGSEPVVLGGDFNTWFGFIDSAYREIVGAFPDTKVTDSRRTFLGLMRLDHLFFRLPDGWRAEFKRAESSFGSDHHPLIGRIQF